MEQEAPLDLQPDEARVDEMLKQGDELRRAEQYDEAIRLLLDALELGVSQAAVYFRLGNVYYDMGDMSRAEYAYKRAIECDEDHANAHHNLSVVYRRTGRISESVKYRKKAYRLEISRPNRLDVGTGTSKAASRRRSLTVTFAVVVGIIVLTQLLR